MVYTTNHKLCMLVGFTGYYTTHDTIIAWGLNHTRTVNTQGRYTFASYVYVNATVF